MNRKQQQQQQQHRRKVCGYLFQRPSARWRREESEARVAHRRHDLQLSSYKRPPRVRRVRRPFLLVETIQTVRVTETHCSHL